MTDTFEARLIEKLRAIEPYRNFYPFDPRRAAILLIGGNKTGDDNFYERMIPQADLRAEQKWDDRTFTDFD